MVKKFYAHSLDGISDKSKWQGLEEHLEGVARLAGEFAGKIGLPMVGELLGLLHDLGKYRSEFEKCTCAGSEERGR